MRVLGTITKEDIKESKKKRPKFGDSSSSPIKFPKLNKGDKVDIIWLDAYNPQLISWAEDEEIIKAINTEDATAESRGYFYCECKGHIYIYGDKLDITYSRVTGIPKGCIIKIKKEKK